MRYIECNQSVNYHHKSKERTTSTIKNKNKVQKPVDCYMVLQVVVVFFITNLYLPQTKVRPQTTSTPQSSSCTRILNVWNICVLRQCSDSSLNLSTMTPHHAWRESRLKLILMSNVTLPATPPSSTKGLIKFFCQQDQLLAARFALLHTRHDHNNSPLYRKSNLLY